MRFHYNVFIFLLIFPIGNACWFSSREKSLTKLRAFLVSDSKPIDQFVTTSELNSIISNLSAKQRVLFQKVGNAEGIMAMCDTNKDGKLIFKEALENENCLSSCWQQMAVDSFL